MQQRKIKRILKGREVIEGAGVRMKRIAGYDTIYEADPFLLFDDMTGKDEMFYKNGFPYHPHRGIECITYSLIGRVEHEDCFGSKEITRPYGAHRMSAGSGIIHKEMPRGGKNGVLKAYALWLNMPSDKKASRPSVQAVSKKDIVVIKKDNGVIVRLISGEMEGEKGPVEGTAVKLLYADITMPAGVVYDINTKYEECFMAYVIKGGARFGRGSAAVSEGTGAVFECGTKLRVRGGNKGVRFLLFGAKPLGERVAWHGPIVMNTDKEIQTAMKEIEEGTFIKEV